MTMKELIPLIIEDGRYVKECDAQIPKLVQAKRHKNWRINKKWEKRYGYKVVYETKKSKILDVTIECIVEFCQSTGLPLPDEMLAQQND